MKGQKYNELSLDELKLKEKELSEQMFNLKFQHATGQLENPMVLVRARKDVARVKTFISLKGRAEGGE
jgi:large subunit ribosomal protein L29